MDLHNNAEGVAASREGRTVDEQNLITHADSSAESAAHNYAVYKGRSSFSAMGSAGNNFEVSQSAEDGSITVTVSASGSRIKQSYQCTSGSDGKVSC